MKLLSVVGARPNFMKVAPIDLAVRDYNKKVRKSCPAGNHLPETIQHILVHTGQHYGKNMSDTFFDDLKLPKPDVFLGVGSASHAVQTAEIMKHFETALMKQKPDIVIVVGDVNSSLACALVSSKISYDGRGRPLIAHVEAGLRSFDYSMPEEINRVLMDHISDILLVTEESGVKNLLKEGIPKERIHFVGNTMIDTLLLSQKRARQSTILQNLGLVRSESKNKAIPFALLTLHRPSNVDDKKTLLEIIHALKEISRHMPVIFPVHPRTRSRIINNGFSRYFNFYLEGGDGLMSKRIGSNKGINLMNPLGYLDFLGLMMHSKMVLTDSGGIQEETTCLGIPCVTIRNNTERPVTVREGTNVIAGVEKRGIINAINYQLNNNSRYKMPKYWDGKAATRILDIIIRIARKRLWEKS